MTATAPTLSLDLDGPSDLDIQNLLDELIPLTPPATRRSRD
jgi:hypothetical protein